jgi:hypothetical protein
MELDCVFDPAEFEHGARHYTSAYPTLSAMDFICKNSSI